MTRLRLLPLLFFVLLTYFTAQGQSDLLVSGPWAGNVDLRTATVWLEPSAKARRVDLDYFPAGKPDQKKTYTHHIANPAAYQPVKIQLTGLEPATRYEYALRINGKKMERPYPTAFTTRDLWAYRKPAPDFSFLTGSCAYFNDPPFDRPGKSYGHDSSIFLTMAQTPADFHLWLGDNWYTRESDFGSAWGLHYRASRDRSLPVLQPLMAAMPQYAIWDDHDYGPNDAGKSYILRQESREVFMKYSLNPSYGQNGEGIYTLLSHSDVDFFLLDDRYFRAHPDFPDSLDGAPHPGKTFYGPAQLDWLMNALLSSRATFKVIVTGSQVLNPLNRYECLRQYPGEYHQLMRFLQQARVSGVLFLTGDRHHSEVIRQTREDAPPLYDITVSPYTSGISKASGVEENNPDRMPGTLVETHNFARISVSGKKNERLLLVEFLGKKGEPLGRWQVSEKELRFPKKS